MHGRPCQVHILQFSLLTVPMAASVLKYAVSNKIFESCSRFLISCILRDFGGTPYFKREHEIAGTEIDCSAHVQVWLDQLIKTLPSIKIGLHIYYSIKCSVLSIRKCNSERQLSFEKLGTRTAPNQSSFHPIQCGLELQGTLSLACI
jgi:hypothetical protein